MSTVKLIAVGDISLQTRNARHPFGEVNRIFADKDILFGNLETVLSSHGKEAEKAVTLHTSPDKVSYLKEAGFDILSVANNHVMDLGLEGFNETLEVLNRNNLIFVGASNDKFRQNQAIVERNNIKLGFLAYSKFGFSNLQKGVYIGRIDESEIIGDIKKLKPQCDAIIVSLHWGIEKVFYPSPRQVKLARKLIDSGASVILGHHPHVIQGIEKYKQGLIAYSLGNFQFEFNPEECSSKRTNQSIILLLEMGTDGLEAYDVIPVKIDDDFVPCIVEEEQQEIKHFLSEISHRLTNGEINWRWWYEQISEEYLSGNMKSFIVRVKKYGLRHLVQFVIWLISPFRLRCYVAVIRHRLRRKLLMVKG